LGKLTPDMAGYRPEPAWWPDLTAYRKAVFLHNISFGDLDALLKEYAAIFSDKKRIVCDFYYTALPDDRTWTYLEFPNFENVPHYVNFRHYKNLLIWLSQKRIGNFALQFLRIRSILCFYQQWIRKILTVIPAWEFMRTGTFILRFREMCLSGGLCLHQPLIM